MKAYLSTKHSTGSKKKHNPLNTPENILLEWNPDLWVLFKIGDCVMQWPTQYHPTLEEPTPGYNFTYPFSSHPKGTVVTLVQP